ncbi:DEAD/DEAH box helicase [candidate division KSB1 bacterium]
MDLSDIKDKLHKEFYKVLKGKLDELRPCQEKAIKAGLFEGNSILVCSPTASGKTLVAEMAGIETILNRNGKAIYIVPLTSLANEKFREFKEKYGHFARIALSIGNIDSTDPYLSDYDFIITTSEKLDSLIRHNTPWLSSVKTVIVDEIHLLNDPGRGPTLEILLTMVRQILSNVQIIGLSATIGNPKELAKWLGAKLVQDKWRPCELRKGVYFEGEVKFG